MPITIDGTGSISGLSPGGLPDGSVVTADLAGGAVTQDKRSEDLTRGTAQASTSGTAIDFTGIPGWAKRIQVVFGGVSLSASANLLVQIGPSGGFETTGYASSSAYGGTSVDGGAAGSTAGFVVRAGAAAAVVGGILQIANVSGNIWVASFAGARVDGGGASSISGGGTKTLAGTLDRVRITSTSTDTFDAGSINIFFE